MSTPSKAEAQDFPLIISVFGQVASNLGLIVDRDIDVEGMSAERSAERARGEGRIHISFKLGFQTTGAVRHGCVLVPLPDAVTLAGCLTMLPDDLLEAARGKADIDETAKDALMELGSLVAGAVAEALREFEIEDVSVESEGCQGVRADVRPALAEPEGAEFVVGRALTTIVGYPQFECIVQFPPFWED